MLRHVVLFTWTSEATADQRQAVATELRTGQPDECGAIRTPLREAP